MAIITPTATMIIITVVTITITTTIITAMRATPITARALPGCMRRA